MMIVLCVFLLLILIVVIVGSCLPRRHVVSRSAVFRASPEKLFALIAGPQHWRADVSRSEIVAGADEQEMLRETDRHGRTIEYAMLDNRPPWSITRRIATRDLPYSGAWTYVLTATAGGTMVRITEDGEVGPPVFRFVSRFVMGQTRTIDAYLRSLGKATGEEIQIEDAPSPAGARDGAGLRRSN